MTSAQIIALARKKIMEKTDEIFSDDDLLLYANNGKDEIAMRFLGKKLIKPATLVFSGGSVTKPTDWNGHYYASTSNVPRQGTEVKLVSIEDYQNGVKSHMVTESEGNLLCYPTTLGTVYFWYYKKLTDMALGSSPVNPPSELNTAFHMPIVYYIIGQALEDAQDFELSKYFNDKYENEYTKQAQIVSDLEKGTQEAGSLLSPLPDLNFGGSGGSSDPDHW